MPAAAADLGESFPRDRGWSVLFGAAAVCRRHFVVLPFATSPR